jgi:pimeloyl-ACP methyl ester carboxylesterase
MQPIFFRQVKSGDAEIFYWALGDGDGPPVVLLHPFPANHEFCPTCAGMGIPRSAKDRQPWKSTQPTSRVLWMTPILAARH